MNSSTSLLSKFFQAYVWRFLLCAVLSFGVAVPLHAQNPEATGTPVHMVVTVEARKGSAIPTINQQDVLVSENKERDTVTDWLPAPTDGSGLEFFILLDDSSNMTLGSQLDDIRRFINEEPAAAKVGVAYMQNGIAQVVQNLTTDHEKADKALRLPLGEIGANGSPYFSLSDLVKRWPAGASRREVLMISNGIDPYYGSGDWLDPYLDAAIDDAQRAGIIVSALYTPGVGHFGHSFFQTYWGQLYMAKLADRTGGESYYIGMTGPPVSFAPYLDDARSRLSHQYLLTFVAKPRKKAGLEPVKITTEVPNADLVAASKVSVPAAK
jgi:hypothetical protein